MEVFWLINRICVSRSAPVAHFVPQFDGLDSLLTVFFGEFSGLLKLFYKI